MSSLPIIHRRQKMKPIASHEACLTMKDECVFLFSVTKFDDATTIKECIDCKDGEVVEHFEHFEDAQEWFHRQFSVPTENDLNDDDSGSMPGLLDRRFEDSDSDDDDDSMPELEDRYSDDDDDSMPELEDRYSDSDDNSKRPTGINDTLLAISKVVMKKEIEKMKQFLVDSGRKIPAKDVDVLRFINTPHLYRVINDGIEKYNKGDDLGWNSTVDGHHIQWQSISDMTRKIPDPSCHINVQSSHDLTDVVDLDSGSDFVEDRNDLVPEKDYVMVRSPGSLECIGSNGRSCDIELSPIRKASGRVNDCRYKRYYQIKKEEVDELMDNN